MSTSSTCARRNDGSSRPSAGGTDLTIPAAPVGVPESFEDHASLMFDLLALAFETDQTRVFTFMMCREFSVRTYPNIGVTDPHHTVSHTQNRPALIAAHTKVNTYHMQLFGKFLAAPARDAGRRRLAARPFHDSLRQRHGRRKRPRAISASDGGRRWTARCKGGRHIVMPEKTPLPNLLLGLAPRFDVDMPSFGDQHRSDQL